MFEKVAERTIRMSMKDGHGRLTIEPPLSLTEYDVAASVLRLDHSKRLYEQSQTPDGMATEFKILVDSERHLTGRANRLLDGLQAVGVEVELDQDIAYI